MSQYECIFQLQMDIKAQIGLGTKVIPEQFYYLLLKTRQTLINKPVAEIKSWLCFVSLVKADTTTKIPPNSQIQLNPPQKTTGILITYSKLKWGHHTCNRIYKIQDNNLLHQIHINYMRCPIVQEVFIYVPDFLPPQQYCQSMAQKHSSLVNSPSSV